MADAAAAPSIAYDLAPGAARRLVRALKAAGVELLRVGGGGGEAGWEALLDQ